MPPATAGIPLAPEWLYCRIRGGSVRIRGRRGPTPLTQFPSAEGAVQLIEVYTAVRVVAEGEWVALDSMPLMCAPIFLRRHCWRSSCAAVVARSRVQPSNHTVAADTNSGKHCAARSVTEYCVGRGDD